MKKKVWLTLTGRQWDETGQENVTKLSAEAEYYERNGSRYILYEENEADTGSTQNIIKLKDGLLELTKKGSVSTRMIFEEGQEHVTDYNTPFGTLQLDIITSGLCSKQSEDCLEIHIDYDLTDRGHILSHCNISIKIQDLV